MYKIFKKKYSSKITQLIFNQKNLIISILFRINYFLINLIEVKMKKQMVINGLVIFFYLSSNRLYAETNDETLDLRFGVGYEFVGSTNILGNPLKIFGTTQTIYNNSVPKTCFQKPGITQVLELKVASQQEISNKLFGSLHVYGGSPEISCGAGSTKVPISLEVSSDSKTWYVAAEMLDVNVIKLMSMYFKIFEERDEYAFLSEVSETGKSLKVISKSDSEPLFHLLAQNNMVYVGIVNENDIERKKFIQFMSKRGYKPITHNESDGRLFTVVAIGKFSPSDIHAERRRIYDKAFEIGSKYLQHRTGLF
jgi:hypothetical protein